MGGWGGSAVGGSPTDAAHAAPVLMEQSQAPQDVL